MAYLAPIEAAHASYFAISSPAEKGPGAPEPKFSDLEWSIINLAKLDGLWTLRPATRLTAFIRRLTGRNPNPALANERLEAIRRIAVLSWHFGFTVPGEDVRDFLRAGFSLDQYELLVTRVRGGASNILPFPCPRSA